MNAQERARGTPSTAKLMQALWATMAPARRRRVVQTLGMMLLAGCAEFATLFAARGFLTRLLGANAERYLIGSASWLALSIVLVAVARLATLRLQDGLVLDFASDSSIEIFSRALRQPYLEHKARRSAELFVALENTQRLVNMALGPMMIAIVNAGLAAALLIYLLLLAPIAVASFLVLLALAYWGIGSLTGTTLRSSSQTLHELAMHRLKAVHEAQSGFRDLVLGHAQQRVIAQFRVLEAAYRKRQAHDRFATVGPRYLVEMTLMLMAVILACVLATRSSSMASSIPLVGVVALGLQRLMPLIHGCHSGWALFQANSATISNVLDLMQRPALSTEDSATVALPFANQIVLSDVALHYEDRGIVLHGVDLTIRKGERIGIVGASGAGKSSLMDILMGLIEPSEGEVRVDEVVLDSHRRRWAWQMQLSSVSQNIYLSDTSIRDIIVDCVDHIDDSRLQEAIEGAQLASFVSSLPLGAATRIGDGGLLLSGGQRQRLALARALYRRAPVLVLDEATSQLDPVAEDEILKTLKALDRSMTILLVTHRKAALQVCDRILELRGGTVFELKAGAPT